MSRAVVVVPAHNEEALLSRCLDAIAHASRLVDAKVDVLLVADACTDETPVLAKDAGVTVVSIAARNVGAARAAGVEAWRRSHPDSPAASTWVATTDADSRVPPHWLVAQLTAAASGADATVGMVRVSDWEDRPHDVARRWQSQHPPVGGHRQVHGANLGIRLAALDRAGGFRPLDTGEDVDLVDRLTLTGASVVRTATAPVVTSARRQGRAPSGFANYLDRLEADLAV